MKRLILFSLWLLFSSTAPSCYAQELSKELLKEAIEQAKLFEKEGWKVNPGLSLAEQIARSNMVEKELDESGYQKWIVAEAKSTSTVYAAAKSQTLVLVKNELAGKIGTEMESEIDNAIANRMKDADIEAIVQMKERTIAKIKQKIQRTRTLMECYRELNDGKIEVLIRIAVTWESANNMVSNLLKDVQPN